MANDERKLYHENKMSYNLCLLFVSLSTLHAILVLRKMTTNYTVGIFFITTIIVLMVGFLCAVKLMTYSIKYGYVAIILGFYQVFQIFTIPDVFQGSERLFMILVLIAAIISIVVSGVSSIVKTKQRTNYINMINKKATGVINNG